jgi:tRNA splicing ligase
MKVFNHHIYEYEKGLRNLILHTMHSGYLDAATETLERRNISYHIQKVHEAKVNIFFGDSECIAVVKSFDKTNLRDFSHEEDFILGIMLGYDRLKQCKRYLSRKYVTQ